MHGSWLTRGGSMVSCNAAMPAWHDAAAHQVHKGDKVQSCHTIWVSRAFEKKRAQH